MVAMHDEDLQREIDACPAVPDFSAYFPHVPALGRRLRVALPCVGVNACGYALDAMQVAHDANNVYDLEAGYIDVLTKQLQNAGQEVIRLNLGPDMGNLLKKGLLELEGPVDFLVAGPPCPPWSGQGSKKGWAATRASI